MKDLIILSGTPGSGKSTIAKILQSQLRSPYIDFGWMREWHLLPDWSDQSSEELEMAFDNLVYLLRNYLRHGYRNVIVCDLRDEYVKRLAETFSDKDVAVVSLIVSDDAELRRRVLGERDSGFKDDAAAIEWNARLKARQTIPGETKIDNTDTDPSRTADYIIHSIGLLNS